MSILRIEQCGGTETVKSSPSLFICDFLALKERKEQTEGISSFTHTNTCIVTIGNNDNVKQRLLEQHLVFAFHSLNIYALLIGKDDTVGRAEPVTPF